MKDYRLSIEDGIITWVARAVYPDIIAFFESEEGQREYEEWLKIEEGQKAINRIK